jgi:hypothetical protein
MALSPRHASGADSRTGIIRPDDALKWTGVERGSVKTDDPGPTVSGHGPTASGHSG